MKKTITATIIMLSMVLLFSGCANVDGEVSSKISQTISEKPLENSSGIVMSDVGTDESSMGTSSFPTGCKVYKQKSKVFTEEQLLSFFSETPEKTGYDDAGTVVYTSDKETGNISPNSLIFYTEAGLLCNMANGEAYGEKIQFDEDVLDFLSRDEAAKSASSVLQNLGLDSLDWKVDKFYSVKAETLDTFKEKAYKTVLDNPLSLDEDELQKEIESAQRLYKLPSKDIYHITFRRNFDGIPIYSGGMLAYGSDDKMVLPCVCEMYISKDGIEYFFVLNITETETYEEVNIIEYDTAKEWIDKKYGEIIFDGEVKVNNIELVYLPVPQNDLEAVNKKFETRPFYAFYCTLTENDDREMIDKEMVTYFDAATGEEFATEYIGYGDDIVSD